MNLGVGGLFRHRDGLRFNYPMRKAGVKIVGGEANMVSQARVAATLAPQRSTAPVRGETVGRF
jgi:hypothetical protein